MQGVQEKKSDAGNSFPREDAAPRWSVPFLFLNVDINPVGIDIQKRKVIEVQNSFRG
jgi:hypothetical protein